MIIRPTVTLLGMYRGHRVNAVLMRLQCRHAARRVMHDGESQAVQCVFFELHACRLFLQNVLL